MHPHVVRCHDLFLKTKSVTGKSSYFRKYCATKNGECDKQ